MTVFFQVYLCTFAHFVSDASGDSVIRANVVFTRQIMNLVKFAV